MTIGGGTTGARRTEATTTTRCGRRDGTGVPPSATGCGSTWTATGCRMPGDWHPGRDSAADHGRADGLLGTGRHHAVGTDVTDANGNYLFDGLPAGAYVVTDTRRHQAATPRPATRITSRRAAQRQRQQDHDADRARPGRRVPERRLRLPAAGKPEQQIGNKVWFDADADGWGGRQRRAPATDNLDRRRDGRRSRTWNGNGIWDVGEPIIATDITDAAASYQFAGLPTATTLVWV